MSAPGAPVFGSVPHQDPVCISGETNAVVTDFFGTISKAAIMQLGRPHLQGPFSRGILNPQSNPADMNIVDGWASQCVCWFGTALQPVPSKQLTTSSPRNYPCQVKSSRRKPFHLNSNPKNMLTAALAITT